MWQVNPGKDQTPTQPLTPLLNGTEGENRMSKLMVCFGEIEDLMGRLFTIYCCVQNRFK